MLKLLRYELLYTKYSILTGLMVIIIFFLTYNILADREDIRWFYSLLGITFYMYMLSRWGHYMIFKENLERLYSLLPLSLKGLAISRLVAGAIIWFSFLSFCLLVLAIIKPKWLSNISFWSVVVLSGIFMILNSLPYIWHDFLFFSKKKHRKLISNLIYYPIIFTLIACVYFLTSIMFPSLNEFQSHLQNNIFTPIYALIINCIGIIFSYLSYSLYMKRRSYLHTAFGLDSNIKVKDANIS